MRVAPETHLTTSVQKLPNGKIRMAMHNIAEHIEKADLSSKDKQVLSDAFLKMLGRITEQKNPLVDIHPDLIGEAQVSVGSPENGIEAALYYAPVSNRRSPTTFSIKEFKHHSKNAMVANGMTSVGITTSDWLAHNDPEQKTWTITNPGVLVALDANEPLLSETHPAFIKDVFKDVKESIAGSTNLDLQLKTIALDKLYQTGKIQFDKNRLVAHVAVERKGKSVYHLKGIRDGFNHLFTVRLSKANEPLRIGYLLEENGRQHQKLLIQKTNKDDFGYVLEGPLSPESSLGELNNVLSAQ